MARARVVAPPPQDYIPEPLVAPVIDAEVSIEPPAPTESTWEDGNYIEETRVEKSPEELEQERIAEEKHDQLQQKKLEEQRLAREAEETLAKAKEIIENPPVVIETVVETVVETVHVQDPETLKELEDLRRENEHLLRIKEAAEKAKEEKILDARKKMTEKKGNQLNIVPQRKPSLWNKFKQYLRTRRIKKAATMIVDTKNYETAIIARAKIAVPKILDDMEKIHEELVILEELLIKYSAQKK
jgi:hypothetical protein